MGAYMSSPIVDKISEDGYDKKNNHIQYGISSMQGWRQSMEDSHLIDVDEDDYMVFGVFDGHGGSTIARWMGKKLGKYLSDRYAERDSFNLEENVEHNITNQVLDLAESMKRAYLSIDDDLKNPMVLKDLKNLSTSNQKDRMTASTQDPQSVLKVLLENNSKQMELVKRNGANFLKLVNDGKKDEKSNMCEVENNSPQQDQQLVLSSIDEHSQDCDKENKNEISMESPDRLKSEAKPIVNLNKDSDNDKPNDAIQTLAESPAADNQTRPFDLKVDDLCIDSDECSNKTKGKNICGENCGHVNETDKINCGARLSSVDQDKAGDLMLCDDDDSQTYDEFHGNFPGHPMTCGATAVVAAIQRGDNPTLIVANAGDSRAVLCRSGVAIPLSKDHKPDDIEEKNRIISAGGHVSKGRVEGNLNLSRSVGDHYYKRCTHLKPEEQAITSNPDIRILPLTKFDEFIVIACDGIWECLSIQEVVTFVKSRLETDCTISDICAQLCDKCLSRNPFETDGLGCDNMTCMVVILNESTLLPDRTESKMYLYSNSEIFVDDQILCG